MSSAVPRLFSASWVSPIHAAPIREGAIVLGGPRGTTVLACGSRKALREEWSALPETRVEGCLMPALVNAHTHLELSAIGRDGPVPGGDGVVAWTRALMSKRAAIPASQATEETLLAAASAAADSARAFGTAAIGDVGNGVIGWLVMAAQAWRGLFFHELVGSRETATGDALADAARERNRRKTESSGAALVTAVAAPHAPYSVGPDLMRRIFAASHATGAPTSIHLAEDPAEMDLLLNGSGPWIAILKAMGVPDGDRSPGMGPTAYLEHLGAFADRSANATIPSPLLVHMVHADRDDLVRARAHNATIVLCPRSNLHIGGRLPDVPGMCAAGVNLAIGTDSLASVPDLSLWQEIALLAKSFPEIPARTWLTAATQGGARALALADATFAPGANPGVIGVRAMTAASDDIERALVLDPSPRIEWIANP